MSTKAIPDGFVPHTESTTTILLRSVQSSKGPASVFLNPVQEYNRDLSIIAIGAWASVRQKEKEEQWEKGVRRKWAKRKAKEEAGGASKKRKIENGSETGQLGNESEANAEIGETKEEEPTLTPPQFKFTCLEALSATGLRAIRYAKELSLLKHVVANDLSASAVEDIRRNIDHNDLSPPGAPQVKEGEKAPTKAELDFAINGIVRPNQGDASAVMYTHKTEPFDCIDLDPYGSAVPFIDAAVQSVADGGLLCVTCTDVAVLAGHNYPEKAFSHYGGVCVNAEYSHEVGLRLLLNAIATAAGRYGRNVEPLLSLSIDFYMRVFIRVKTSPKEVKALATNTTLLFYCHDCQSPHWQPMGRTNEKKNEKNGQINHTYHLASIPPPGMGDRCAECGGKFHIGGPMWGGPLHNRDFIDRMLEQPIHEKGTASRIEGMIKVAQSELDAPLCFTPSRLAAFLHCTAPPLNTVASALLNGGYKISRSHTVSGSIKTDAPRPFVMDVMREWIKSHPVKRDNVKEGSPTARLLDKAQTAEVSFDHNKAIDDALLSNVKLVKYQMNPTADWGPGRAAWKGTKKGGESLISNDPSGTA